MFRLPALLHFDYHSSGTTWSPWSLFPLIVKQELACRWAQHSLLSLMSLNVLLYYSLYIHCTFTVCVLDYYVGPVNLLTTPILWRLSLQLTVLLRYAIILQSRMFWWCLGVIFVSIQGLIQDGTKIGHGGPFLQRNSSSCRKATVTTECTAIIQKHVGRSVVICGLGKILFSHYDYFHCNHDYSFS